MRAKDGEILPRIPHPNHDDVIPCTSAIFVEMRSNDSTDSLPSNRQFPFSSTSPPRLKSRRRISRFCFPLLLLFGLFSGGNALKCYCTDDHCVPFGACEGPACLVGILRDTNQVIRTCGTRPIGCHKDDDEKWTDLCACDQPFCNTFSYLRSHTRKETGIPSEDTPLIFQRMDRPDDGHYHMPGPDAPLSTRSSMLTTLLVVVPLTVGGAAIAVVAFNYYCHLC
ncbi:unnamed protein product, partial [Mesorhabditis belari]|uniref:Uncharacterized protein n=1 Tax=Mesorhabditis belari TaxID=2138241 RepID=A0AAF3FCQ7_9BILA